MTRIFEVGPSRLETACYTKSTRTTKIQEPASLVLTGKALTKSPRSSIKKHTNSRLKMVTTSPTAGMSFILSFITSSFDLKF